MSKYITIIISAEDEVAARQLTPGKMIGANRIVSCCLGDAITLNDKLKELVPDEEAVSRLELENISEFLR